MSLGNHFFQINRLNTRILKRVSSHESSKSLKLNQFKGKSPVGSNVKINTTFNRLYTTESNIAVEEEKEFLNKLKLLTKLPLARADKMRNLLNSPLTEKERALEHEINEFVEEYKNMQIKLKNNVDTNSFQVNTNINSRINEFPFLELSPQDKPYSKQELTLRQWKHSNHMAKLGAEIENIYFPMKDVLNPPSIDDLDINKLMAANVHLGQSTSLWRPSTQPFIYGIYKDIHLIDLNKTLSYLKRACKVVEGIAEKGGIILFLGTKSNQKLALEKAATRSNGYFVYKRWIPGTLTNLKEITGGQEIHEVDALDLPTERKLSISEKQLLVKPDLIVVLNPTENRTVLNEAMKCRVPTIGIIDTDSEPSLVTYPVPGNDDSSRSINLLLGVLSKSAEIGLKKRVWRIKQSNEQIVVDI